MTTQALANKNAVRTIAFSALPSSRDPASAIQREYEWVIEVAGVQHTITLFHSKQTGTVRASLNGKQFYERYIPPTDIYFCYFYAVTGVKNCRLDIIHTPEGVELSIDERNFTDLFKEQNPDIEISKVRILPEASAVREPEAPPVPIKSNNSIPPNSQLRQSGASQGKPSVNGQPQSSLLYNVEVSARQQAPRQMESSLTGSPVPFQQYPQPPYGYGMPPAMMPYNQLPPVPPPVPPPLPPPAPPQYMDNPFLKNLPAASQQSEIGPSMLYQNRQEPVEPEPITFESLVQPGSSLVFPDDPNELNEIMKKAATLKGQNKQQPKGGYGRGSQENSATYRYGSDSQIKIQSNSFPPIAPTAQPPYPYQPTQPGVQAVDPLFSNPLSAFFAEKLLALVNQNNLMNQQIYGSVPPASYGSIPPVNYLPESPMNYDPQYYGPHPGYGPSPLNYKQPLPNYGQQPTPVPPVAQQFPPGGNPQNYTRPSSAGSPPPPQYQPQYQPQYPPQQLNYQQGLPPGRPPVPLQSSSQKDIPKSNTQLPPPGPTAAQRPPLPKGAQSSQLNEKTKQKTGSSSQLSIRSLEERTEQPPPQLSASGLQQLLGSTTFPSGKELAKPQAPPPMRQVQSQVYTE